MSSSICRRENKFSLFTSITWGCLVGSLMLKLIQVTQGMHERKKKEGETLSLRRNDFFNRDNQKYYLRIQINKLNWEKLLGLSQSGSLLACIFSRRMTVHYWLMWCYISVWSYVSAFTPRPFSDGWLFLEVSQRAALNKLSTGRVTAFPGIIRQMTDSSALHLFSPRPLLIQNLKFC